MHAVKDSQKEHIASWFENLRNEICISFEKIEQDYLKIQKIHNKSCIAGRFERKNWARPGGGGGQMSIMRGEVFEKVGVNISTVYGQLTPEFAVKMPGCENSAEFFATGISIVAHMNSPFIPAFHFNSRYIETSKSWFGGGIDMTPTYPDELETKEFHQMLKNSCDTHDKTYYPEFKKKCDQYFYLPHRDEPRGVGGIFYDYLNTGNFENDYSFVQSISNIFPVICKKIIKNKIHLDWSDKDKQMQLEKRGRYVEFNLLYDRGTKFGLETSGNIDAILMSMPPIAKWK